MSGLTPMMQQFNQLKAENPENILFFRLGDFYEMFGPDAEIGSRELDLVLTSRDAGASGKVPMCGFPHHAADNYIYRLVEKGYKVAICEQMEDPKIAKGLVKREVVRIITPGTLLDGQALPEKQSNYLAALVPIIKKSKVNRAREKSKVNPEFVSAFEREDMDDHLENQPVNSELEYDLRIDPLGLAVIEASTGEFFVTEFAGAGNLERALDELVRLEPAEILVEAEFLRAQLKSSLQNRHLPTLTSFAPLEALTPQKAQEQLLTHFNLTNLASFGGRDLSAGLIAAAGLLCFLQETQKVIPQHIERLKVYTAEQFMLLDSPTRRNLELTESLRPGQTQGSLLSVIDRTLTAMGGRTLRNWVLQPLLELSAIEQRLEQVDYFVQNYRQRHEVRALLKSVYDLERLLGRIAYGTANPRDLEALKQSLQVVEPIRATLTEEKNLWAEMLERLDPLPEVIALIENAIAAEPPINLRVGGLIRSGFHAEVDRLRELASGGKQWIAGLEAQERSRTGIKSLKIGFNKVFGYYLEVTNSNLAQVPEDYHRKQTLANAERFITPELKEYEAQVLAAEEQVTDLEYRLFIQILDQLNQHAKEIQRTAQGLAGLDVLAGLAEIAVENNYVKPELNTGVGLEILEARHPVVEKNLRNQAYVPNDLLLEPPQSSFMVLTGPNMGGKSTYCRSMALICLLAQIGSFVPAKSAKIGVVDRIFARIGASDDLWGGQSTFMVEMHEVANIVHNASERSLVILDEVGRGTSTYDGLSIAWALTEYVHNALASRTLFATHYHELTELEAQLTGVHNYSLAVREQGDEVVFLRRVVPGEIDRSYGIEVARLAGLPKDLVNRARQILHELERREGKSSQIGPSVPLNDSRISVGRQSTLDTDTHFQSKIGPEQLSLVDWADQALQEEILQWDLLNMTPFEAFNQLWDLQQRIREQNHRHK